MITNKDVVQKLVDYFLTQNPEDVARLLANNLIDFNRIFHSKDLQEEEYNSLVKRIKINLDTLNDFVKNGAKGPLKFVQRE